MSKARNISYGGERILLITTCIVLSIVMSASATDEAAQEIEQLEKLEQDREKAKREKASVLTRERSILSELEDIEKELIARERELRIYKNNLAKCEKEIDELNEALKEAEHRSKQTQALMIRRLRAMYRFGYQGGQLSYLKLLLGTESISDLTNRYKYMSAIALGDRKLMEKAVAEKEEISYQKKQVEARKEQILVYKAAAERTRKEILSKRQTRQNTLGTLQKSKEYLTRTLAELERSIGGKEALITQLRDKSVEEPYEETTDLGEQRGKLLWPVSGKIVKNSAPSMKGVTIQARYGADILCVASGTVEYAQWFDGVGFGQMVIVAHGNGYRTLYAHASELLVKKGQKVTKGQLIARVGDTGSLKGSILYFEIWKGTKAMLTRQWLQ